MPLRISLCQKNDVTDELASFGRQLGVTSINITQPPLPLDSGAWEVADLLALRERCESRGLTLEVIENVPHSMFDPIARGTAGRNEALDALIRTIHNMSRAGIPMLGYHFMPNGVWRTQLRSPARGGATASAYDDSLAHQGNQTGWPRPEERWSGDPDDLIITADQMWDNYRYFLEAVLPVADEVGLKLAQHPDDPPVQQIDGFARIFTSPDAFSRAQKMAGTSQAWGINLCLGTVSEMNGAVSVNQMIERFVPSGQVRYVHFRDVKGTVPSFVECFLGEGNYVPHEVIKDLLAAGFTGWLQDDHVPNMVDDTQYGRQARAYEIGFMQGILSTLN